MIVKRVIKNLIRDNFFNTPGIWFTIKDKEILLKLKINSKYEAELTTDFSSTAGLGTNYFVDMPLIYEFIFSISPLLHKSCLQSNKVRTNGFLYEKTIQNPEKNLYVIVFLLEEILLCEGK